MLHLYTRNGTRVRLERGDRMWIHLHVDKKSVKSVDFFRILGYEWELMPDTDPLRPLRPKEFKFKPGQMTLGGWFVLLTGLGIGADKIGDEHYRLYELDEKRPIYLLYREIDRIKARIWYKKITEEKELEAKMKKLRYPIDKEKLEEQTRTRLYNFLDKRRKTKLY